MLINNSIKNQVEKASGLFSKHRDKIPIILLFLLGAALIHRSMGIFFDNDAGKTEKILVATKRLKQGDTLQHSNVRAFEIVSKHLPLGSIKAQDFGKIAGMRLSRDVEKDEFLFWNLFQNELTGSVSSSIERGFRVISIPVDTDASAGQQIQEGDHVDIILTTEIPGESKNSTITLLQNVTVFSTGLPTQGESTGYSNVSLMVLPSEVNLIVHSSKHGNLTLSLRHPADNRTVRDLGIISGEEIVQTAFRNQVQTMRDQSNLDKPLE